MVELTKRTEQRIAALFPDAADEVGGLLRRECADNLPLVQPATPEGLERIRFAVLKLSDGRLDRLSESIRLAQIDWRDALMAAGFGEDTQAHLSWQPA